jgi:TDG/mug DNA glycosylase family protein
MAAVLPDILPEGLRVVFCGTAAGTASAHAGAYYAGPGNGFWRTLHETGLTPVELSPAEFQRLPEFGIGLTDICKVLHGSDLEVGTAEFDLAGLEARIATAEPANLAFNGKNAARGALERAGDYGLQPERIGGATVWVLPSTSGAARRFWQIEPWRELARAVAPRSDQPSGEGGMRVSPRTPGITRARSSAKHQDHPRRARANG